jgi:hypothetical protein
MSRLGAKGGGKTPFGKALENKKSSQIALRLNSYGIFLISNLNKERYFLSWVK